MSEPTKASSDAKWRTCFKCGKRTKKYYKWTVRKVPIVLCDDCHERTVNRLIRERTYDATHPCIVALW